MLVGFFLPKSMPFELPAYVILVKLERWMLASRIVFPCLHFLLSRRRMWRLCKKSFPVNVMLYPAPMLEEMLILSSGGGIIKWHFLHGLLQQRMSSSVSLPQQQLSEYSACWRTASPSGRNQTLRIMWKPP